MRHYEYVKQIDPRKFNLSKFTLNCYLLHRTGMTVTMIARSLGVERRMVVEAITSVWEMDNPKASVCDSPQTIGQVLKDVLI